MKKKITALLLSMAMLFGLSATAFAAVEDTGFSDVSADAEYAEAVIWCRERGVMNGTSDTAFSPEGTLTRAMVATVLYRWEKSPAVGGSDPFTDNAEGTYYHDAVIWAAANGIINGYDNGNFGPNDPVTREQLAVMLHRRAGTPASETPVLTVSDANQASAYAQDALRWAVGLEIVKTANNALRPRANATRAEVAVALMAYLGSESKEDHTTPNENGKVLVAYFSATNNTEGIAEKIAASLDNADLYEITPAQPYTAADLNYNTDCRANDEQNDPNVRPEITGTVENWDSYDVVFLGYPIWWGVPPRITQTFLESYDLSGKTIVPFCTSGGSGYNDSNLAEAAPGAEIVQGQRFRGGASQEDMTAWVDSLGLDG